MQYEIYSLNPNRTTMRRQPSHTGYILKKDYLVPLDISVTSMAETLSVSRKTLSKILNERGSVTPDTELPLSRILGMPPGLLAGLATRLGPLACNEQP